MARSNVGASSCLISEGAFKVEDPEDNLGGDDLPRSCPPPVDFLAKLRDGRCLMVTFLGVVDFLATCLGLGPSADSDEEAGVVSKINRECSAVVHLSLIHISEPTRPY